MPLLQIVLVWFENQKFIGLEWSFRHHNLSGLSPVKSDITVCYVMPAQNKSFQYYCSSEKKHDGPHQLVKYVFEFIHTSRLGNSGAAFLNFDVLNRHAIVKDFQKNMLYLGKKNRFIRIRLQVQILLFLSVPMQNMLRLRGTLTRKDT